MLVLAGVVVKGTPKERKRKSKAKVNGRRDQEKKATSRLCSFFRSGIVDGITIAIIFLLIFFSFFSPSSSSSPPPSSAAPPLLSLLAFSVLFSGCPDMAAELIDAGAAAGVAAAQEAEAEAAAKAEAEADVRDPKEGAEVERGHAACFKRAVELLEANGLPGGLLPLEGIEEAGYVEGTGYFWVRQASPKGKQHRFEAIGKTCHYAQEISGYFQRGCLRQLKGVSSKEALLLWFTIVDIFTNPNHPGEIYFKTQSGLGRWLPAHAFALPPRS